MPVMPRPKGRATKIAYDILGIPAPLKKKRTRVKKEIDLKIDRSNTLER